MADSLKLVRIASLKTVAEFRKHAASLGIDLPCDDTIAAGAASPLAQPVTQVSLNGKRPGNRYVVQPMEGWDGTTRGGITDDVLRRWQRFGQTGAKLIFGGEAMAVRPDGRANPNQLIINEENKPGLARLREALLAAHKAQCGTADDVIIGFQLTHSGRFCKPNDKARLEPRVAYRHPILDRKFGVTSDTQVWTDSELDKLIEDYAGAARIAWDVGADFVDIKHCHGYLLHEVLGAFTRPGKFGGSFENRTRLLRDIVAAIRAGGNRIEVGVRLSAFDLVPFKPDPARSLPGKPGPGVPEDFSHCLPYRYGFGVNQNNPLEYDLTEAVQFLDLCGRARREDRKPHSRLSVLQSPHPTPCRLPTVGRLPTPGGPAARRGAAGEHGACAQSPSASGPAARGQRLQLPPGVFTPRSPGCGPPGLDGHGRHRARGAFVSRRVPRRH